jgi:hypothetical protein
VPCTNPIAAEQLRVPLPSAARRLGLTRYGLLKILRRTDSAIRDDGRWFVSPRTLEEIEAARRVLGIDRHRVQTTQIPEEAAA